MTFYLSGQANFVLDRLRQNGFEAYLVGGCVRDLVMGKTPVDWDIATSALPQHVIDCFAAYNVIKTGMKHGTVIIVVQGQPVEITTYRIDGEYADNRRPTQVTFTPDLREDLSRRDFTINAMAYDKAQGIFDVFGGLDDLRDKIIRCVGQPEVRFAEDALRMMRALRFASVLGFAIEPNTQKAMDVQKQLLTKISMERITKEFCQCLLGAHVADVLKRYSSVISVFIPELLELTTPKNHDIWRIACDIIALLPSDVVLRLTALCCAMAQCKIAADETSAKETAGNAKKILKRLRLDSQTIHQVEQLIVCNSLALVPDRAAIKRWLSRIGVAAFEQLLQLKTVQFRVQNNVMESEKIRQVQMLYDSILQSEQCFSLKDLNITGNDLTELGIHQGIKVGEMLACLLDLVIDGQLENQRQALLDKAKELNQSIKEA